MTKKKVKINRDTIYNVLESKIKENKIYKDYNALIDSIRVEVKGVFFY
jgi:hypothetical protein